MPFHHEADESFALLGALGQKLLGRGADGHRIRLHLELRHRFHGDRNALVGIQALLRRHVKRHQFEGEILALLHHRKDDRAAALDDARAAEAVNDQGFVRTRFAVHSRCENHEE